MSKWIDENGIHHELSLGSVWTTGSGKTVKSYRHNTFNPKTGHGHSKEYTIRCEEGR
jgi:hypothetical protein